MSVEISHADAHNLIAIVANAAQAWHNRIVNQDRWPMTKQQLDFAENAIEHLSGIEQRLIKALERSSE